MTVKLKKFRSNKHLRKKTKVDRAINLAGTISRKTDPLRHLYVKHSPQEQSENQRELCF